HTRAGTRDVVEVHGSIARFPCLACRAEQPLAAVLAQLETREAPICEGCGAILKPGVVMFGELLPVAAMERAAMLAREAGLLLVVGSSLQVWPVAGLPGDTVRAGGALAIVNLEETPYDAEAEIVVRGPSGSVLAEVARALDALWENASEGRYDADERHGKDRRGEDRRRDHPPGRQGRGGHPADRRPPRRPARAPGLQRSKAPPGRPLQEG